MGARWHLKTRESGELEPWSQCRLDVGAAGVNVFIQEFDETRTTQGLDFFQYLWAEPFDVVHQEVILQPAGTSPHERAERALVRERVHIPHVSFEFLDPPEVFATIRTGRARFAGADRGRISPVLCRALGSEMLPDSWELSLVEWKVGLLPHLD